MSLLELQQPLFWQISTGKTGFVSLCRTCSTLPFKRLRNRLFNQHITTCREGRLQRVVGHNSFHPSPTKLQNFVILSSVPRCFTVTPSPSKGQISQLPSYFCVFENGRDKSTGYLKWLLLHSIRQTDHGSFVCIVSISRT